MSYKSKGFSFSFIVHLVVGVIYYYSFYSPKLHAQEIQSVTISLVEKEIEKIIKKESKIIEKKEILRNDPAKKRKVIPKEVKKIAVKKKVPVIKPKQKVEKKVVKKMTSQSKKTLEKEVIQKVKKQTFIQTNFTVIRDKVLQKLVYPRMAKKMKYTGVVELELVISTKGELLSVRVKNSSGRAILDKAALKAANKIKSQILPKPNRVATVILPVSFKLKS